MELSDRDKECRPAPDQRAMERAPNGTQHRPLKVNKEIYIADASVTYPREK